MGNITMYVLHTNLPENKTEARKLRYKATNYMVIGGKLYKRSYYIPCLSCMDEDVTKYILDGIYKGICGNHTTVGLQYTRSFNSDITSLTFKRT